MTNLEFVKRVLEIAETNPTYREGGDGSDGTCDCIGLIMGALGGKFDMHSTNYFARFELAIEPQPITDEDELQLGDLVFKARNANNPMYDLHERYKEGGRYFINDLLDYYHVGVVTGTSPLVITHCTQTNNVNGIAKESTLVGWTHVGMVDDLEYEGQWGEPAPVHDLAIVYSEDGNPVRMRKAPTTASETIVKIPKGAQVEVTERADGWSTILWNGKRGYMMSEFLRVIGMVEPPDNGNEDPMSFEAKVLTKLDEILLLLKGGVS